MKTEKEKMLAGEVFNVYDPELVKERQYARQLVERFNALGEMNPIASNTVIRQLFGYVGKKCEVHPQFKCDYGYNIYVDNDFLYVIAEPSWLEYLVSKKLLVETAAINTINNIKEDDNSVILKYRLKK